MTSIKRHTYILVMTTLLAGLLLTLLHSIPAFAKQRIVNVYAWTGEIPESFLQQFEKETGIHVNFSTYPNNEIMYAKIRSNPRAGYDVIMPSSYFVDRMRRQGLLYKLDKNKLPNWGNLDKQFLNLPFDPKSEYCAPYIWGSTGIFYNTKYFSHQNINRWSDLWEPRFNNQLMLLNDTREVFAVALLTLGYSPNDRDPEHIKQAYLKLRELMPNVKVFSTETVVSILIDEDATVGMAWNGDTFKGMQENKDINYVYPKEGYVIWVDSFAIPKQARHLNEAHAFINFMLSANIGKQATLFTGFATANKKAKPLLPANLRDNPVIYPSRETLKRGQFQIDVGDDTLALYEKYWEQLKMGG